MKKYIVLVFIIFFVGCGKNEPIQSSTIPTWYLNSPNNTPLYLYGEGSGYTLEEAKINALNTMASKLIVSISSSLSTQTNTYTNSISSSYDKSVSKKLNQDVEKIEFTNATVEKAEQIINQFYVLMRVNREQLFLLKKKDFINQDKRIEKLFSNAQLKDPFEKIFALNEIIELSKDASKKVKILNAIDNDFNAQKYINKYTQYQDIQNELKHNTPLQLSSNLENDYFKNIVKELLSLERYKISQNSQVKLELFTTIQNSQTMGWNIVKANTNITLKNNTKILSSYTINSIGRSSTSKESAISNAALDLKNQIKKKRIENILFGNNN